jgi:hypothetical protein
MASIKFQSIAALALLSALAGVAAHAESEGQSRGVAPLPKYAQECSACHVAYPVGMLPAASWQRIMGSLGKHYGTDASLDDASAREIGAWLKANAGTYRRASEAPPQDRISLSTWFVRTHDEVAAATWKRASIGSAANCSACHTTAAEGNYSEHKVRIPK